MLDYQGGSSALAICQFVNRSYCHGVVGPCICAQLVGSPGVVGLCRLVVNEGGPSALGMCHFLNSSYCLGVVGLCTLVLD